MSEIGALGAVLSVSEIGAPGAVLSASEIGASKEAVLSASEIGFSTPYAPVAQAAAPLHPAAKK